MWWVEGRKIRNKDCVRVIFLIIEWLVVFFILIGNIGGGVERLGGGKIGELGSGR